MGKTTDILIAGAVGLAAGLVLGFLFAPDKGSVTRKKFRQTLDKIKENLSDDLAEQVDKITNVFSEKDEAAPQQPTSPPAGS